MAELPNESGTLENGQPFAPDLEALMLAYQQADRTSAELFMEALVPILRRFFMSTVDGRQYSDDLIQETLLRIHKARHSHRPSEPVLPWVFAISRHAKIDFFRRRQRSERHETRLENEALERHAAPAREATSATTDFESLLSTLPESQKQVLTMLKVLGMSIEEVARATSSTAGSVKQKAHRAYQRLRSMLDRSQTDAPNGASG
jgi:RNA polymerase sigma-70 factor (ECF subfamily)